MDRGGWGLGLGVGRGLVVGPPRSALGLGLEMLGLGFELGVQQHEPDETLARPALPRWWWGVAEVEVLTVNEQPRLSPQANRIDDSKAR